MADNEMALPGKMQAYATHVGKVGGQDNERATNICCDRASPAVPPSPCVDPRRDRGSGPSDRSKRGKMIPRWWTCRTPPPSIPNGCPPAADGSPKPPPDRSPVPSPS
eukprot:scaffold86_cov338-Pavlova_lutheri.AAC.64